MHGFRLADRNRLKPFAYARDGFARLSPNIACAVRQLHGFERGSFEGSEAHAAAGIGFPGRERLDTSAHLHDGIARLSPTLKCAVQQLHDVARPRAQRLRFLHMPTTLYEIVGACRMRRATVAGVRNAAHRMPQPYSCPRVLRAHFLRFPPTFARSRPAPGLAGPRPAPTSSDQFRPVPDQFRTGPTSSEQAPTSPLPALEHAPPGPNQSEHTPNRG